MILNIVKTTVDGIDFATNTIYLSYQVIHIYFTTHINIIYYRLYHLS